MRYIVMVGVELSFRVNDKKLRRRSRFFGCGGASWVVVVCHEEAIDSDLVEVFCCFGSPQEFLALMSWCRLGGESLCWCDCLLATHIYGVTRDGHRDGC